MAHHSLRMGVRYRERRVSVAAVSELDRVSAACALSLAATVLFSTLLVWAKEAYAPLHALMTSLTGHHWTTHGLVDVVLFALLAALFHRLGLAERMRPQRLVAALVGSVIVAGLGIVGFFLFF